MTSHRVTDEELLKQTQNGSSGDLVTKLYNGSADQFDSIQKEVYVYCCLLAREQRGYTDRDQIDRLVRGSQLMHDRWDDDEYRTKILTKAIRTANGVEANNEILDTFEIVFDNRGHSTHDVAGTKQEPRSLDDVIGEAKTLIEAIMRYRREASHQKGHTNAEKKRVIADIVVNDLRENGRFISPETEDGYYFYEPEQRVYPLHGEQFGALLEEQYDLTNDAEGDTVIGRIETETSRSGETASVHRFAYWSEPDQKLHIHDRDGGYYAIGVDDITHHSNGENGVFFLPSESAKPIEYIPAENRPDAIDVPGELPSADQTVEDYRRILVNRANFVDGAGLSKYEQRVLLDLYLHTLPFGERMPEKPLLAFKGVKGSGKTGIQRMLGQFFCGTQWEVRHLTGEEDFWVGVTNNAFVAFDNLDTQPKWLNDGLASVATGTLYTRRKLYTTNEEVEYRPKCWVAVNAREPKFNRDDVSSRLIILTFGSLNKKCGRRAFNKPLRENSNSLWSECMDTLQEIVAELANDPEDTTSSFRMADWVNVAMAAAEPLGYDRDEVEMIIEKLGRQQAAFTLEDDPRYQALKATKDEQSPPGLQTTAKGLHTMLKENHPEYETVCPTSRSLATWIAHHRDELNTLLGFEVIESDRENRYRLPP